MTKKIIFRKYSSALDLLWWSTRYAQCFVWWTPSVRELSSSRSCCASSWTYKNKIHTHTAIKSMRWDDRSIIHVTQTITTIIFRTQVSELVGGWVRSLTKCYGCWSLRWTHISSICKNRKCLVEVQYESRDYWKFNSLFCFCMVIN